MCWCQNKQSTVFNPLNAELNPIYHLLSLLGAHHILHVSRVRVKQQCSTMYFHKFQSSFAFLRK
jgi:hypothetical protein